MHPKAEATIQNFANGNREAVVERVILRHTPFRVVFRQRPQHGSRWVTLNPYYEVDQDKAIERAKKWVDGDA